MIEDEMFKRYVPDYSRFNEYGFVFKNNCWIFEKLILNDSFRIVIRVIDDRVNGKVIDLDSDFEYTAFRVNDGVGEFSSKIRELFTDTLLDIREKCFNIKLFVSNQANRIGELIYNKYGDLPYYEWDSTPDTGVFKHKITKKWYGIVMNVKRCKISSGDDLVDVLNVKIDAEKVKILLQNDYFYPAYHMNKKYWISVILDDSVNDDEIMNLVDESYLYASNK